MKFVILIGLLFSSMCSYATSKDTYQGLIACEGKMELEDWRESKKIRVFTNDDICNIKVGSTVKAFLTFEDSRNLDMTDFFPTMIQGTKTYESKDKANYRFMSTYKGKKSFSITFKIEEDSFYDTGAVSAVATYYYWSPSKTKKFKMTCQPPAWEHGACGEKRK